MPAESSARYELRFAELHHPGCRYAFFCDARQTGQFVSLEAACRRSGGIVSADEVVLMLRNCGSNQPLSKLARWIVARDVMSFEWRATTWLPLFQFERGDMSLRPGVSAVVCELSDVFDVWELMAWFTSPNTWLCDMAPADLVAIRPAAVLEAARADRFISRG